VLADAGEIDGVEVVEAISSDPLRITALALHARDRTRVLLANLSGSPCAVRLEQAPPGQAWVRYLDERSFTQATCEGAAFRRERGDHLERTADTLQVSLLPYAVARVDVELEDSGV
jgi:hypothetical protein